MILLQTIIYLASVTLKSLQKNISKIALLARSVCNWVCVRCLFWLWISAMLVSKNMVFAWSILQFSMEHWSGCDVILEINTVSWTTNWVLTTNYNSNKNVYFQLCFFWLFSKRHISKIINYIWVYIAMFWHGQKRESGPKMRSRLRKTTFLFETMGLLLGPSGGPLGPILGSKSATLGVCPLMALRKARDSPNMVPKCLQESP